ncbi:MAG: hypothetical protein D6740_01380, partial [Alphaproteobacteria bacterium]
MVLSWFGSLGLVVALSLTAALPSRLDHASEHEGVAYRALPCGLDALAARLAHERGWRDIGQAVTRDARLQAELADMMPAFDLAFVHDRSHGVLLVQGSLLDEPQEGVPDAAFWEGMVAETRQACLASGVSCTVERLKDAPYGIAARTELKEGDQPLRRITVAFIAPNSCSYAI